MIAPEPTARIILELIGACEHGLESAPSHDSWIAIEGAVNACRPIPSAVGRLLLAARRVRAVWEAYGDSFNESEWNDAHDALVDAVAAMELPV